MEEWLLASLEIVHDTQVKELARLHGREPVRRLLAALSIAADDVRQGVEREHGRNCRGRPLRAARRPALPHKNDGQHIRSLSAEHLAKRQALTKTANAARMRVKQLRAQLEAHGETELVARFLDRSPCATPYHDLLANETLAPMYMPYDGAIVLDSATPVDERRAAAVRCVP